MIYNFDFDYADALMVVLASALAAPALQGACYGIIETVAASPISQGWLWFLAGFAISAGSLAAYRRSLTVS
jgi:hypothetical protein